MIPGRRVIALASGQRELDRAGALGVAKRTGRGAASTGQTTGSAEQTSNTISQLPTRIKAHSWLICGRP